MKTTTTVITSLAASIIAALLVGCSSVESALTRSGQPVSTNRVERVESMPVTNSVTLATVTETPPGSGVFKTNLTTLPVVGSMPVTNYVLVTNYAPHPDYTAAIGAAGAAGRIYCSMPNTVAHEWDNIVASTSELVNSPY